MDEHGGSAPDLEALIGQALERLPEEFRRSLHSVAIVVDDYPTTAQLASTGARGLLGLYEGVPRTSYGASAAPYANKITLFRVPLMTYHRTPDALAAAVEKTLFHEIGHHMGISDVRLTELEAERRRSR